MPTIVVTGGLGLIGSTLVTMLPGARIRIFDNSSRPSSRVPDPACEVVAGDVRDFDALAAALRGAEVLVHLAAYGSVVESVSDPLENFEQNVLGTFTALRAARQAGVKRVIFASTGGALIGEAPPPVNEDSLPKPISPYGASKLCGEAYCHAFGKAYGLETVALRFANVYGPWSAHKKGAVTAFIKSLMTGQPITIFGDGKATRDFLYVEDLCQGIVQAVRSTAVQPGDVFHLASSDETSVLSLARLLCQIAGKPGHPIEFAPPRPAEVSRNFAQHDKAARVLGFAPKYSLLEGLEKTYRWYLDHREMVLRAQTSDS